MPKLRMRLTCCTVILFFVFTKVYTQGSLCPPNIDFKYGDFSNWECKTGIVQGLSGVNTITWFGNSPDPNRHFIIPVNSTDRDQFGNFPINCPGTTTPS